MNVFLKSKMFPFSSILAGVTDFGMAMTPLWTCQRSTTWAGVLLYLVAMSFSLGSWRRLMSPGLAQGLSGEPGEERGGVREYREDWAHLEESRQSGWCLSCGRSPGAWLGWGRDDTPPGWWRAWCCPWSGCPRSVWSWSWKVLRVTLLNQPIFSFQRVWQLSHDLKDLDNY